MYGFLIAIFKRARVNNLLYLKDNDISVNFKELKQVKGDLIPVITCCP